MAKRLSEEEQAKVVATIQAIERRSAGEVVVAWLPRSDSYWGVRIAFASFFAWLCAYASVAIWRALDSRLALLLQLACFALALLLASSPWLLRMLLPASLVQKKVQQKALELFSARGVHRTRDRSGLLLLVSELEHQVVLLGDEGVHRHLGDEGWKERVKRITEGIREGRAGEALLSELAFLGELLAAHFPVRPDDENELSDEIVKQG